jgi:hypothetical protein
MNALYQFIESSDRSVLQISNVESLQFGGKPAVEASTFEPPTHAKGKKKEETRGRKKDDRAQEFSVASGLNCRVCFHQAAKRVAQAMTICAEPRSRTILTEVRYCTSTRIPRCERLRMQLPFVWRISLSL